MKNINKLLLIATGLFVLFFTACTEEDFPAREPSPEVGADNAQVYFPDTNPKSLELDADVTAIPVTIQRGNTANAITVPITVLRNDSDIFTIPESVSFESGQDEAIINVSFSNAETATDYSFEIIVEGEEYVDPYTMVDGAPSIKVTMALINWVKFATGTYESTFFETSWEQDLYRAEGTDKYRFYDLFAEGYHFDFFWDGGEAITPVGELDASGYYIFETGYMHPDYGMVTVHIDSSTDWTYYVESADAFVFNGDWRVSAGSFGWLDDFYYIEERF